MEMRVVGAVAVTVVAVLAKKKLKKAPLVVLWL